VQSEHAFCKVLCTEWYSQLIKLSSFIRSAGPEESGDRYINPSTTEALKGTVSLLRPFELAMSGCLEGVHFANGVRVERSNDGTIASICN
jgi:hypothetical protein